MATIAENLERIETAKEAIKDAIVAKGGAVQEDARIDEYPAAIEALPSGDDTLDKIFDKTVEEIRSTTPIKYGRYLFYEQPRLRVADIVLSDIINTGYQYDYMFQGCTSLTKAPELPATTLAGYCYEGMFIGCTSLTTAPELPATTLKDSCYRSMFYNCQSLTQAPALPATTLASGCYKSMFNDCTSLTTAPELPATTLKDSCYLNMFEGCTSLTQGPDLPATTLAGYCYQNMFYKCTSLQKTGKISATGSISSYINYMFQNCSSLREMTWTATTPPTITSSMWSGCPADFIIYVPDEAVDKYKAASVWSSRANYIKGISEKPTE